MNIPSINHFALAFLSGIFAAIGFSPWDVFPLPIISLALLFHLTARTNDPRTAAGIGFVFGLGMFGVGIGWIYVALHDYGDMPILLALLATLLFVSLIASFSALFGYVQAKIPVPGWVKLSLVLPALWVAAELLRGHVLTGFPWLAVGYSQIPSSPLAGYVPVLGVYGVSLVCAVTAGLLTLLAQQRWNVQGQLATIVLLVLWLGGMGLRLIEWTIPEGEPIKVSLLQGNIAQDKKFDEGQFVSTLETYRRLLQTSDARLIVLPETALPLLRDELPESYLNILRDHVRQHGGDVLIGAFEKKQHRYYNSMFSLGASESQSYHKNHLVPFGEFIPLRPLFGWVINDVLDIPMSDLAGGGENQPLLRLAGQRIAMDICYEDVFGEEIIRALPQATLLLNASNDAWYGDSHAAMQHNQIAQVRALESGRMMLRATNTGVTSVIGSDGRIREMLPQHQEGVLTALVQGYTGTTPYVRWGNAAVLVLIALMLGMVWKFRKE